MFFVMDLEAQSKGTSNRIITGKWKYAYEKMKEIEGAQPAMVYQENAYIEFSDAGKYVFQIDKIKYSEDGSQNSNGAAPNVGSYFYSSNLYYLTSDDLLANMEKVGYTFLIAEDRFVSSQFATMFYRYVEE